MVSRAGLANQDMEFVQFHPTGTKFTTIPIPFHCDTNSIPKVTSNLLQMGYEYLSLSLSKWDPTILPQVSMVLGV